MIKRLFNKKGLSLVEVVIAMLLIAIMSAAVLGTVFVSRSIVSKNTDKLLLAYTQDNIIKCYSSSSDLIAFERSLVFCFGQNSFAKNDTLYGADYTMYFTERGKLSSSEEYLYIVRFSVTQTEMQLYAMDKNGKEIDSVNYPKGNAI